MTRYGFRLLFTKSLFKIDIYKLFPSYHDDSKKQIYTHFSFMQKILRTFLLNFR